MSDTILNPGDADRREFASAIAAAAQPWETFIAGDGKPGTRIRSDEEIAASVLAMPEMQTLRRVLRRAWGTDIEANSASLTRNLRHTGLHESFVQWVVQP